jgi:hypothetical protein
MEAQMLQQSNASPASESYAVLERVRKVASALGCSGIWARVTGPYILLGARGGDAFARLTALGGESYGLAFRTTAEPDRRAPAAWDPVLLIDELSDVIEHALVGAGANASPASA